MFKEMKDFDMQLTDLVRPNFSGNRVMVNPGM